MFFHSLKQAVHLLNGSTRPYYELTMDEQKAIWRAASSGSLQVDLLEGIFQKLCPAVTEEIKSIPLRVLQANGRTVQRMCPVARTLGEVLEQLLPSEQGQGQGLGEVLIQGVLVQRSTPVLSAWQLMHHLDLFLYVCL